MIVNKKIAIVGFGIEGVSCANYLGARNQIFIIDQKLKDQIEDDLWKKLKVKDIKFIWRNRVPKGLDVDFVVRSPGARPDAAVMKKLLGKKLTYREIYTLMDEIAHRRLSDVLTAYFAASSFKEGFTPDELYYLTKAMVETGTKLHFKGIVADKHSTGGVAGTRTTMIIVPIIAGGLVTMKSFASLENAGDFFSKQIIWVFISIILLFVSFK